MNFSELNNNAPFPADPLLDQSAVGGEGTNGIPNFSADASQQIYIVQPGDTPSEIAEEQLGNYQLWDTHLLQSDGTFITSAEARTLQIGEALQLLSTTPEPTIEEALSSQPTPAGMQAEYDPLIGIVYTVQQGDTPSEIAQEQLGNFRRWSTDIFQEDGTNITPEEATNLQIGEKLQLTDTAKAFTDSVVGNLFNLSTDFYEYKVSPSDTPAEIAQAVYGDSNLASFLLRKEGSAIVPESADTVENVEDSPVGTESVVVPISALSVASFKQLDASELSSLSKSVADLPPVKATKISSEASEIAGQYAHIIKRIHGTYTGRTVRKAGMEVENVVIDVLKREGYQVLPYKQIDGYKGFDGILKSPTGEIVFLESKMVYGKPKSFGQSLGKGYKFRQTSQGWTKAVAELSEQFNDNPEVLTILKEVADDPSKAQYIGVSSKVSDDGKLLNHQTYKKKAGGKRFRKADSLTPTPIPDPVTAAPKVQSRAYPADALLPENTSSQRRLTPTQQIKNTVDDIDLFSTPKSVSKSSDDILKGGLKAAGQSADDVAGQSIKSLAKGSGKSIKGIPLLGTVAGVGIDTWTLKEAYDADGGEIGETFKEESAGVAGGWAGAAGGAAAGAAIGSVVPGVGTAIGGVVGGIIGGVGGGYVGTEVGKGLYRKKDEIAEGGAKFVEKLRFW